MRTLAQRLAATLLLGGAVSLGACSSAPIAPTYTQEDLKIICERQRGVWHRDDLMGGYCEYRAGELGIFAGALVPGSP